MSKQPSQRQIFIWNVLGSASTAAISVLLLMVVSRLLSQEQADLYSFAYALGTMLVVIGLFQVRNFQSTDIERRYSFATYWHSRLWTCGLMLVVALAYTFLTKADSSRSSIILIMCFYRMTDALSDLYQGFFQQEERLDLAGKSLVYRNAIVFVVFSVILLMTKSLFVALWAIVLVSSLAVYYFDVRPAKQLRMGLNLTEKTNWSASLSLLSASFPLFLNGFLLIYIQNQPKYVLEHLFLAGQIGPGLQTAFNILFMPAFVMNLMMLFFRPMITEMAIARTEKQAAVFKKIQIKLFTYLGMSSLVILVLAALLGLPVLEWLYGLPLQGTWPAFMCLMLGGAISGFATALDNILTAMRKQHLLLIPYSFSFLVALLVTGPLVASLYLFGAALSFLIASLAWLVVILGLYHHVNRKDVHHETTSHI